MYAVLKQQQQIDTMQHQIMGVQGTIDALNEVLTQHASTQADSEESHTTRAVQLTAGDNEQEWESGEVEKVADDAMVATASNPLPSRANSAPVAPSSKHLHTGSRADAPSESTNSRAPLRR